jgi:thiamine biosynthesis lipoprotein
MTRRCVRRARPALGTLVEVGVLHAAAARPEPARRAVEAAWGALAEVERALSAFVPESDIGRFNVAQGGEAIPTSPDGATVLAAAAALARETDGLFDISQGTGPRDWSLGSSAGVTYLYKHRDGVRLDLGGIGKGYAVDRAFEALVDALAGSRLEPRCWVNAGGDLRVAGVDLPVQLRDEVDGGARPWLVLREGALATSWFGPGARSCLASPGVGDIRHVSVVSPLCLWSDALTKVVASTGRTDLPLLGRLGATAWLHAKGPLP